MIDVFLSDAAWAIRSTYHTVLKASPGAAIFGRDMLFDIPFIAAWKQIGEYRLHQTDRSNMRENSSRFDYDLLSPESYALRALDFQPKAFLMSFTDDSQSGLC